jgi:WD40 repeat protein
MASPLAFRLAGYLAFVPLVPPTIRAVQHALLPQAGSDHLAEVFLGGVIGRKTPLMSDVPPELVEYDFHTGVREELMGTVLFDEAHTVLRAVGNDLERRLNITLDFGALARSAGDGAKLPEEARPFAEISALALRRFGSTPPRDELQARREGRSRDRTVSTPAFESAHDVLYDRPLLVMDPGMHTSAISGADVDADGRFAVTGSHDKTVRVWSLVDGRLERTIRLPTGLDNIGKTYAVAISPDAAIVAAGGWTRSTKADVHEQIYLFDRASGRMTARITGLPNVVHRLVFSHDGDRLAALLGGGAGLRLFAQSSGARWTMVASHTDYGDRSYGAAFAADGRLVTTSYDGRLRLYDSGGNLLASVRTAHSRPFGLAINPVDERLAVGFEDSTEVRLYDGAALTALPSPDVRGIDNGNLSSVAWSADGGVLFAAGRYTDERGGNPVVAWNESGFGSRFVLPAGGDTVTSLHPLPGETLLVAATDPWLGVIADGGPVWVQRPKKMDARGQMSNLATSSDGMLVEFGLVPMGEDRRQFDMASLKLLPSSDDGRVARPVQNTLAIAGWEDATRPTLDGVPLSLERYERSRSLAISSLAGHFILGTDWWLRAFDRTGVELWKRPAPGVAWAVNISGDGRLAVAAYGDGTIRWHRMDDGVELLALFPMLDKENWVAWTHEGVYAASSGAKAVLRWHVNRGWDAAADAVPVTAIPETHRPEVIPHVLTSLDVLQAISVAELAKLRAAVQRATGSDVAPGARLHVLAIGVSEYGEAAQHLELSYAHQDARDVAAALRYSQSSLYAQVHVSELVDADATMSAIFTELAAMREAMSRGNGADLAVILFSGHAVMAGGVLYLLPHGVDTRSAGAMRATALPITQFRDEIAAIAQHGRVIMFLDASRSGGAAAPADGSLRASIAARNVTVFTSSSAGELSVEDAAWANGALTEALLEALSRADPDRDGLISVTDLANYLASRVPALTNGRQHPEIELNYDARIFVAGI